MGSWQLRRGLAAAGIFRFASDAASTMRGVCVVVVWFEADIWCKEGNPLRSLAFSGFLYASSLRVVGRGRLLLLGPCLCGRPALRIESTAPQLTCTKERFFVRLVGMDIGEHGLVRV